MGLMGSPIDLPLGLVKMSLLCTPPMLSKETGVIGLPCLVISLKASDKIMVAMSLWATSLRRRSTSCWSYGTLGVIDCLDKMVCRAFCTFCFCSVFLMVESFSKDRISQLFMKLASKCSLLNIMR